MASQLTNTRHPNYTEYTTKVEFLPVLFLDTRLHVGINESLSDALQTLLNNIEVMGLTKHSSFRNFGMLRISLKKQGDDNV